MSTVFGALNRFISRLDSDAPSSKSGDGPGGFGFQVLRNKNPEIAIEPWYDFVIGINGRQVVSLQPPLPWYSRLMEIRTTLIPIYLRQRSAIVLEPMLR